MKNIFITTLSVFLFMVACSKDEVYTESKYNCTNNIINTHPNIEKFQTYLDEKTNEGIPGISMYIESPQGTWAGASGYADIASNVNMQPCNISRTGSITKMFTATLIMYLYDNNQLRLDDNISNYLDDEIIKKVENAATAKIENLLNHSSGITNFETDAFLLQVYNNPNKHWTAEEDITYAYNKSADFEMGTRIEYSNTNFLLLGLIAEHITGKTGTQLYKDIIFDPLGLTDTSFNQDSEIPDNAARGYYDYFGDLEITDVTEITYAHNSMEGGILSNPYELNLFIKGILTPNIILSEAAINKMLEWSSLPSSLHDFEYPADWDIKIKETRQGLGWAGFDTDYGNAIGHSGSVIGYSANMLYFPDTETYISVVVNGGGGQIDEIASTIYFKDTIELLFE